MSERSAELSATAEISAPQGQLTDGLQARSPLQPLGDIRDCILIEDSVEVILVIIEYRDAKQIYFHPIANTTR